MPGLLKTDLKGSTALTPPQAKTSADRQSGSQERAPNVSPEEQQQYDDFIGNYMLMTYDKKVLPQVLGSIKAAGDPVKGLGETAARLVMRMEDSAREQGKQINPDVLFNGAAEIIADLAETVGNAGIHKYAPDEIERAMFQGYDAYRVEKSRRGELDARPFQQDLQMLQQANQEGRLDEILPGLPGKVDPPGAPPAKQAKKG